MDKVGEIYPPSPIFKLYSLNLGIEMDKTMSIYLITSLILINIFTPSTNNNIWFESFDTAIFTKQSRFKKCISEDWDNALLNYWYQYNLQSNVPSLPGGTTSLIWFAMIIMKECIN